MVPYVMAGVFTSPADAFFESVSAFTDDGDVGPRGRRCQLTGVAPLMAQPHGLAWRFELHPHAGFGHALGQRLFRLDLIGPSKRVFQSHGGQYAGRCPKGRLHLLGHYDLFRDPLLAGRPFSGGSGQSGAGDLYRPAAAIRCSIFCATTVGLSKGPALFRCSWPAATSSCTGRAGNGAV